MTTASEGEPSGRVHFRLREGAARLLAVAVGLGVGLLGAEVTLRLLRPQAALVIPDGLYLRDGEGFQLRPGFRGTLTNHVEFTTGVSINRLGLRGPEIDRSPDGSLRILALGDSFTFGVGVEAEETFVSRLAAHFEAENVRALALNSGLPGYGVPSEVRWLERHGLKLEPDLIVLAVFVGNDLDEAACFDDPDARVSGGFIRHGDRSNALTSWLYLHSHFFRFLKLTEESRWYNRIRSGLGLPESRKLRNLRTALDLYRKQPNDTVARGREATARALDRLATLLDGRDIPVVAMIIPTIVQVDAARWAASLEQLGADGALYDPEAPTRIFHELLASRDIPVLDLGAAMTRAEKRAPPPVYFPLDRHWTPAGHQLAAELLAEFLAERGFPDDT